MTLSIGVNLAVIASFTLIANCEIHEKGADPVLLMKKSHFYKY